MNCSISATLTAFTGQQVGLYSQNFSWFSSVKSETISLLIDERMLLPDITVRSAGRLIKLIKHPSYFNSPLKTYVFLKVNAWQKTYQYKEWLTSERLISEGTGLVMTAWKTRVRIQRMTSWFAADEWNHSHSELETVTWETRKYWINDVIQLKTFS